MNKHPLSVVGAVLTTISAVFFLFVFLADLFGLHVNPYMGIVFFLVMPALFVLGLIMIPAGVVLERRRRAKGLAPHKFLRIDLNIPRHRRVALAVVCLTLVNLLIVSLAAFRGLEFMDSPQFCGQVCHTVMEPEFVAYQDGPHSRVPCVECHVGPGAAGFMRAKLAGTRQVIALARDSYTRPVPSPVHSMRPARETCEHCHWPEKFHGDRPKIIYEYASDEKNTESMTKLMIHIGGGSQRLGGASGIHWHMNGGNEIEFISDEKREVISYVRLKDLKGNVREFRAPDVTDEQIGKSERRRMDCMDCHNRPSHPFSASPERAVDAAITRGEIPRDLPFARREAVNVLKEKYPDRPTADKQINDRLRAFYGQNYAALVPTHTTQIEQLIGATQRVYARNIFPKMGVTWGTHPNQLGHVDGPGCFRCHDDQHKTPDGRVIKQDCELCHQMVQ